VHLSASTRSVNRFSKNFLGFSIARLARLSLPLRGMRKLSKTAPGSTVFWKIPAFPL
jgi:hypothetical protein